MNDTMTGDPIDTAIAARLRDLGDAAVTPFDAAAIAHAATGSVVRVPRPAVRPTSRIDRRLLVLGLAATLILAVGLGVFGGGAPRRSTDRPPSSPLAAVPLVSAAPPSAAAVLPASEPITGRFSFAGGGLAFGPDGSAYVTVCDDGVVLRITGPDTAILVAGGSKYEDAPFGDGGPATVARLDCPTALAFDADGRLVVSDAWHNRIRRIGTDGRIETIAGFASLPTFAGNSYGGDGGPAYDAKLKNPTGLAIDAAGSVVIADQDNHRVRAVSPDGVMRPIAGSGNEGFDGDFGSAIEAGLSHPSQLVLDAAGDLYVADTGHQRVRRITPDGRISTIIGDGTPASGGDGGRAVDAQVHDPIGLAVDRVGNLYVGEYSGHRIRRIRPDGTVDTIAGTGTAGVQGVNGAAREAELAGPGTMAIGDDGALYVIDDAGRLLRIDLDQGFLELVAGGPDGVVVR
jgi:NHL repeat